MSDIWDEKPESNLYPLKNEPSDHWYEKFNMDAWLEKVKAEYDEIREKARRFDEGYKTYFYKDEDDNAVLQIAVDTVNKAEKWGHLKPETKTILEIATEYDYDDVMAGRLSPDHIKELLDTAFWEHGVQKGTWILEFEKLKKKLEAIKKWLSETSMTDEDRSEVDKILGIEA